MSDSMLGCRFNICFTYLCYSWQRCSWRQSYLMTCAPTLPPFSSCSLCHHPALFNSQTCRDQCALCASMLQFLLMNSHKILMDSVIFWNM